MPPNRDCWGNAKCSLRFRRGSDSGAAGCGNAGPVESVEKQKQLFHSFHRPLEISPKARDSHIPTARLRGDGKVENQKQVSHFPTAARDDDCCSLSENETKKGVGRFAASHFSYPAFMLILRLENAPPLVTRGSSIILN